VVFAEILRSSFVTHLLYFTFAQWHRSRNFKRFFVNKVPVIFILLWRTIPFAFQHTVKTYIIFLVVIATKDPFISSYKFPLNAH